jgi:hypothetical protein
LADYPKAKYAYAWTYLDGNQNKTTVVLKIPPVDSPQTAVKVADCEQRTVDTESKH